MNIYLKNMWIGVCLAICFAVTNSCALHHSKNNDDNPIQSSSVLNQQLKGGVAARNNALEEIIHIIQAHTGIRFILGMDIGQKSVTCDIRNDPTVKEVLDIILPELGLAYFEMENGLVYVDTIQAIQSRKSAN